MLAIRMQRIGRKGLPHYRVVVQDSRRTPSSGRVVSTLGSYDPHTKKVILDKEKSQTFLDNGAQPSDRVTQIFKQEGLTMPSWLIASATKERGIRNPDKLRKNQPKAEVTEEPAVEPAVAETEAPVEE